MMVMASRHPGIWASGQGAGSPLAASRISAVTGAIPPTSPSPQPSPPRKSGRGGQCIAPRGFRELGFRGRGFTLTELLVAIGIIALLSTLTVVSVKSLSNEARLSSGRNAVVATLASARAYAMKNNTLVCVAFRVNWDPNNPTRKQFTEMVVAEWKGERQRYTDPIDDPDDPQTSAPGGTGAANQQRLKERFIPVEGLTPRPLPPGVKVAAPFYDVSNPADGDVGDNIWVTQPQFPEVKPDASLEPSGRMIAVMFASDGTLVTRNPSGAGDRSTAYVDFNGTGRQLIGFSADPLTAFFVYDEPSDEPNLNFAPFLAVYDDAAARELAGAEDWSDFTIFQRELTAGEDIDGDGQENLGYISKYADRIHFNRYTGVIMK